MPSRRPHKNSHHGCLQCKAKRVKCDQTQPSCARCVKRGSECTYRHLMTSYNPFKDQQAIAGASPAPPTSVQDAQRRAGRYFDSPHTGLPLEKTATLPTASRSHVGPEEPPAKPSTWPLTWIQSTPATVARSAQSAPPSTTASGPYPDSQEQLLLNHYRDTLSVAHMSPVLIAETFPALNEAILRHAATTPYVRHLVLSFSALHLASITSAYDTDFPASAAPGTPLAHGDAAGFDFNTPPPHPDTPGHYSHRVFLSSALTHKDKALRLFLPAVRAGVTEASAEALFVASIVLIACELGVPAADPTNQTAFDRIDILAHVAGLFVGTNHFLHHNEALRRFTPHAMHVARTAPASPPTFRWDHRVADEVDWTQADASVARALAVLHALAPTTDSQELERRDVLGQAGQNLRRAISIRSLGTPGAESPLGSWLGTVKSRFVDLMRLHDPLALVLVAHWIVCGPLLDVWWASGWSYVSIVDIGFVLDDKHKSLLHWCSARARMLSELAYQVRQPSHAGYRSASVC